MEYCNIAFDEGVAVDVRSCYRVFMQLADQRSARGIRYALPVALTLILLAKLAGQDTACGMATWLRHRAALLVKALKLSRPAMPHRTTISRILGQAVNVDEFEQQIGCFFENGLSGDQEIVVTFDGKTIRGTIEADESHGLHLLAAYVPQQGVVLLQVEVDRKENEIVVAPQVLERLELRNRIFLGDALHTQRQLSAQIVTGGGDYVWKVKDNQPQLKKDIAAAFEPAPCAPGHSATPDDMRTASTVDKGHGRLEKRTITVTQDLKDYLDWPGAQQVFKLERHFVSLKSGSQGQETIYGVTSLPPDHAGPARLMTLNRSYWGIENGLHYRRDVTFREDSCRLKLGNAAHMMAAINNLALGLILRNGNTNAPEARRWCCAEPLQALELILRDPW